MSKKIKKTKKPKKTVSRKRKVVAPAQPGAMAIIPYSEIAKPETYQGKYTLIPTLFNERQIMSIIAPTPKNIIKQRPGKGGGKWDYVPGWWFKKKANFVFGFSHDFDILGERVDGDFITVKGKLTVRNPKTGAVIASKSDYGSAAIKYCKGCKHTPENYLDIGNDFKAAQTDCFKRCMVQFGFAMDVYGTGEMHDNDIPVQGDPNDEPQGPTDAHGKVVETAGIQPETEQIMKICKDLGATSGPQIFAGIKKVTGYDLKSWALTPTQAKDILSKMLAYKHQKQNGK